VAAFVLFNMWHESTRRKTAHKGPPRPKQYRWGDNDHHLGPFLYSRDGRGPWTYSVVLVSAHGEDPFCTLRLRAFGHTLIITLPHVIKPWRRWCHMPVTVPPEAGDAVVRGYWDEHAREYGFSYSDGFLHVLLGAQTHDSSTTQSWNKHLPWTQWRHVRHTLFDRNGMRYWTQTDKDKRSMKPYDTYEMMRLKEELVSKRSFQFADFDGERLTAVTMIEEREWAFGDGWFKWLSLFRKNMVRRSLDIEFSGETGKRKGSWKGGTLRHSIDVPRSWCYNAHENAFRRYCTEHDMTFIGEV
jgi:hypothetical protein